MLTGIRTSMIDLKVDPKVLQCTIKRTEMLQEIQEVLFPFYMKKRFEDCFGDTYFVVYSNDNGSLTFTLKTYPFGLVTLTFEDSLEENGFTNTKLEDLRKVMHKKLRQKVENYHSHLEHRGKSGEIRERQNYQGNSGENMNFDENSGELRGTCDDCLIKSMTEIPIVKRGSPVPLYFTTCDERLLEYDFDEVVFEEDSPYQNIKILHSPTLGNCLILDDLQNLAESDLNYTHGVMKYGSISYTGKDVLILGGGDGGLLHELLKEHPKFVTMVDIDETVVDACRKYLRGCCGDSLDNLEGPNYKVIIDDCIKKLDEYKNEGRKFDVIINDLTDIPISTSPQGELWDFVKKIITMSLAVLKEDGSYLNHALGEGCVEPLKTYENMLSNLPTKVTFQSHSKYVPSFMENWVFYEIKKI